MTNFALATSSNHLPTRMWVFSSAWQSPGRGRFCWGEYQKKIWIHFHILLHLYSILASGLTKLQKIWFFFYSPGDALASHEMVPETAVLISTDLVFGLHYWDFRSAYSSVTQQVSPTTHFYLMTSGCCLCDRGPKISYPTLGSSETRNCVCVWQCCSSG